MWLLLFAFVAGFVLSTGECQTVLEVDVSESRAFRYSITGSKIQSCYVTLPNGRSYELLPNVTIISSVDERYTVSSSGESTYCGLSIDYTRFSDSGSYSLNVTDTAGGVHRNSYALRVQGRTSIWPSSNVRTIAYETVYIFLPDIKGTVCYLTPPRSSEIEIRYGSTVSGNIKQWSPNPESWCGAEIRNISDPGYWKLTAAVNSTHFYYNRISLHLQDSSTTADTWKVSTPIVGQSLREYIGHENASYCQLENPQGELASVVPGRCSLNLPLVTSQHNGTWIAHTGLKGSPSEITESIDLAVREIPYIYTGSSRNEAVSGAVDIYCRVEGVENEICRFVSPLGEGVSMIVGVGNDKYAPYYDPNGLYTCGLTILQLSTDDYGTWQCYTGNSSDLRTGYISITKTEVEESLNALKIDSSTPLISESYTAYAVYNESLTLACSSLTSLSYCWFRHPNGSYYAALPDAADTGPWTYSGDGLSLGSCSITFAHSTYNDSGSWTCNMGISGRATDLSVDITVRITSSALAATSVEQSEGNAAAVCSVLEDSKALSYCRFIRPDGIGINVFYADSDSKYRLIGDLAQGTCGIDVRNVDDVDIGTWVCAGKLQSGYSELSDTFIFSSAPAGLGLSFILLIGTYVAKIIIY